MPLVTLRKANNSELDFINSKYDEVEFIHSDPSDWISLAEIDGVIKGQGRMVKIDLKQAELGGMYVYPEARGLGLAEKIVNHLLESNKEYLHIYCLPFSHLAAFYKKFGFGPVVDMSTVPATILKKHSWCNSHYDNETLLFVLNRNS